MILARALRFGFQLLYHQLAWTYDLVAALVSAGLWTRWVRSVLPHLEGAGRILEVGHGPGHLLGALLDEGRRPVGIDLSSQMGRQARRRLAAAGHTVALVLADARRLPFPSGWFDAVVATFPAEYIAERSAWESLARVLAPEGIIVVLLGAVPSGRHPLRWASRALFRITGQAVREEIVQRRLHLTRAFDEIGLSFEYRFEQVGPSETFCLLVHRTV